MYPLDDSSSSRHDAEALPFRRCYISQLSCDGLDVFNWDSTGQDTGQQKVWVNYRFSFNEWKEPLSEAL